MSDFAGRKVVITLDDYKENTVTNEPTIIGYEGEIDATELEISIPQEMLDAAPDSYALEFELSNFDVVPYDGLTATEDDTLLFVTEQALMVRGAVGISISAYKLTNDVPTLLMKSPTILAKVLRSTSGNVVNPTGEVGGVIAETRAIIVQLAALIAAFPANITIGTVSEGASWSFTLTDGILDITYVPYNEIITVDTTNDMPEAAVKEEGTVCVVLNRPINPHFEESLVTPEKIYNSLYIQETPLTPNWTSLGVTAQNFNADLGQNGLAYILSEKTILISNGTTLTHQYIFEPYGDFPEIGWYLVGGDSPTKVNYSDIPFDDITGDLNLGITEGDEDAYCEYFNSICSLTSYLATPSMYVVKDGVWVQVNKNGTDGVTPEFDVGTVENGEIPAVTIEQDETGKYLFNFVFPAGADGVTPTITGVNVTNGETASGELVAGENNSYTLNLVLPQGEKGDAASITVGSITPGTTFSITNVGTASAPIWNIVYPALTPLLALPQNLTLTTNTDYTGTMSQSGTFILPTSQDLNQNASNVINVDLVVVGTISISWGTTLFANAAIHSMPAGSYNISFVWSNANQKWGVVPQPWGVVS